MYQATDYRAAKVNQDIRDAMKKKRVSAPLLARKMDVSTQTIYNWLNEYHKPLSSQRRAAMLAAIASFK